MFDLMIDIETLSTETPKAAVISIGYLMFKPNNSKNGYYYSRLVIIDQGENFNNRYVNWDTIKWHMSLPEGTNSYLNTDNIVSLKQALIDLVNYIKKHKPNRIWTNGICFDISILEDCFKQFSIKVPWKYNQTSDARTMYKICNLQKTDYDIAKPIIKGNTHNPLYDCKMQVNLLKLCLRK